MNTYHMSCPIIGYLHRIPHEDGELNEAMLNAFDNADFGKLQNVDMTEELWQVRGYFQFSVKAATEQEALQRAQATFDKLWDNGDVDCGDLEDTYREEFHDGNREEFRISYISKERTDMEL